MSDKTPAPATPELSDEEKLAAAEAARIAEEFGDFGEFKIEASRKPAAGNVHVASFPPALVRMLEAESAKALKDPDYEVIVTAKDLAAAKRLALWAAAWGKTQEPKLYIHKVPNRRDMPENVARLSVELDSEVPDANRPGRKK